MKKLFILFVIIVFTNCKTYNINIQVKQSEQVTDTINIHKKEYKYIERNRFDKYMDYIDSCNSSYLNQFNENF